MNATVDKKFDMFEIYVLRNVLSVPADLAEWVRLKHYEVGCWSLLEPLMLIWTEHLSANALGCPKRRIDSIVTAEVSSLTDIVTGLEAGTEPERGPASATQNYHRHRWRE